ncbi:ribonuclease E activity regulator RraA [Paracoccus sp. M683]|nr:ribonuclease E activity regulator RraA [uncultured Paracoccus sp.]TRW95295.1 ribonuclease E activity regulator RraA [Paracoccus sp. M683]
MQATTADLHDSDPDGTRVVEAQFRAFGQRRRFWGHCVPVRTYESHLPVLEALRGDGQGKVLVVDGGGSLRIGIMGDRLAEIGVANGWVGVVINGAIRDSVVIDQLDLGVRALGVTARRGSATTAPGGPESVGFGGVRFTPDDWIYVDEDAVIVRSVRLDPAELKPLPGAGY